jgi:murein DD-endopeptidase MepM/ murein hydrolase activator NlpD
MRLLRRIRLPILLPLLVSGCIAPRLPIDDVVLSPYGLRWLGILPGVHRGVDLRADEGTPVHAMDGGRVIYAGVMSGFGNVVRIDHENGVVSLYAHLSRIQASAGSRVRAGETIGLSGSTGSVTGPHLHFEVWSRGRPVDPLRYLGVSP